MKDLKIKPGMDTPKAKLKNPAPKDANSILKKHMDKRQREKEPESRDPVRYATDRVEKNMRRGASGAADASRREEMKLDAVDLDVILDERGRELLGEHDRWFDLKRTGKLIERAYRYNPFVSYYDNLNENHLVRPIPQDERNKVDGLTQNEGY